MIASFERLVCVALCLILAVVLAPAAARAEHYAILYNGGASTEENQWYYYENTRAMYSHLVYDWDWDPQNVTVIASDGLDSGDDYDDYWGYEQNSDWSTATALGSTVLPATRPNLEDTIKGLDLGPEDLFFLLVEDHGGDGAGNDQASTDQEFISGWGSGNEVKDEELASWTQTLGSHRQVYVFGTCHGGGMMDELLIEAGDWQFGCAGTVHFEEGHSYWSTSTDYTSFSVEFVQAATEFDQHTTGVMFQTAYDNCPYATDGKGAPWGEGISYTEEVQHPYAVGDNLDLKPAYWMGDGTPGCDTEPGAGPDTDWADPDNWNDGHMPQGNGTALVRFYGSGGRATVTDGLHPVGALIVDYDQDIPAEVGGAPTGMHLMGTGGIVSAYSTVGCEGRGYLAQSQNSTHEVAIELTLGRHAAGDGEYCLWNGLLRVPGKITVGDAGQGLLDIRGGQIEAGQMNVALSGQGEVHHHDGHVGALLGETLDVTVAAGPMSVGSYTMYPGTAVLEANNLTIGGAPSGNGTFTQQGGVVAVNGEFAAGGSTAIYGGYLMEDGLLTTHRGWVGKEPGSTGEFVQSGGTVQCLDEFTIGGGSNSDGTLRITGGVFDARDQLLCLGSQDPNGDGKGVLKIEDGLVIANELDIVGAGSYIGGGDATQGTLRVNAFPQLGGPVDVNLELGHAGGDATGTYIVHTAQTPAFGGDLTIGYDAPGQFIQQGQYSAVLVTGDLTLGALSGSNGGYSIIGPYATLDAPNVIVGGGGEGVFYQPEGTVTAEHEVIVGWGPSALGRYEMDTSYAELNASALIVGRLGAGTFAHDRGIVDLADGGLVLAKFSTGDGTYELAGGSLTAATEYVGMRGEGTFTQTGGTNTVGTLYVAWDTSVECTYTLNAGDLNVGTAYVGNACPGRFLQAGVDTNASITELVIGNVGQSTGTYTLTHGDLEADDITVGYNGTATFTQETGTSNTVEGTVRIGRETLGDGTYEMNGGLLSAGALNVGGFGKGLFDWAGGAVDCGDIHVGPEGRWQVHHDWTCSGRLRDTGMVEGFDNRLVIAGSTDLEPDLAVSSGGHLHAGSLVIGSPGTARAVQTASGTVAVDGRLCLGKDAGANGTYELAGQLDAGSAVVGFDGTGTVRQAGGTTTIAGGMVLGLNEGSFGTYQMSDGVLQMQDLTVGERGTGTFLQGQDQQVPGPGPEVHVGSQLMIGLADSAEGSSYQVLAGRLDANRIDVGGTGVGSLAVPAGTVAADTVNVTSGGLSIHNGTVIADTLHVDPGASFSQTGPGGVLRVNSFSGVEPVGWGGSLHLGHAGGAGQATRTVADGDTVAIVGNFIVGYDGAATLTQTGGSVEPDSGLGVGVVAGGRGTYEMYNPAVIAASKTVIGESGIGHFVQEGGTHSVGSVLSLGLKAGGRGTYEFKNGQLNAPMMAVGYEGAGSFTQAGGTATIGGIMALGYEEGGDGRYDIDDGQMTVDQLLAGVFGPGHVFLRGGQFEVQDTAYVGSGGGEGGIYLDKGSMDVAGQLVMQPLTAESSNRGKLFYYLYGTTAGADHGQILGTQAPGENSATLGGTLVADFTHYAPHTEDTFVLLDGFDINGRFDAVAIRGLEGGFLYDLDYSGRRLTLEALSDGIIDDAVSSTFMVSVSGVGGSCGTDGGVDTRFDSTEGGRMITEYRQRTFDNMRDELPEMTDCQPVGQGQGQYWDLSYEGTFAELVEVTFQYDESLLAEGYDETQLGIYHYNGTEWEMLQVLDRDAYANRLTVLTDSLSAMVLVPEPATLGLLALGGFGLLTRRRRRQAA